MDEPIDNIFTSDDTLFHFTNYEAYSNIISSGELRLSKVANFSDPIEHLDHAYLEYLPDSNDVNIHSINLVKNKMYVFCACSNKTNLEDHKFTLYSGYCPEIKITEWAIFKLRMWDQYADKQKGVCLLFSQSILNSIVGTLKETMSDSRCDYVNYIDKYFDRVKTNISTSKHWHTNNDNRENEINTKLTKNTLAILFYKTLDYFSEGEYRIVLLPKNDEDKDYYYLDISDALIGVVTGVYMSKNIRICTQTLLDSFNLKFNKSLKLYDFAIKSNFPNMHLLDNKKFIITLPEPEKK
ncbi:MAG: DUF2971 domain-containing protein [Candidatus Kapabacteria bacterium]|nr:DUF2971 domain-containing protein [Candidatus Kapabacteria bacterium]